MPLTDLRLYIEALRGLGEIQEIDAPVSLDLELGAIIRRCIETGAPAPLFNTFSDHAGGFRILGAPGGTSAQPGKELVRVAVALELPPTTGGLAIAEAIAASLDRPPIDPVVVDDAPVFENTFTGDAVDLAALPAPLLHYGDGGRYLNTFGCIVARTPDGTWTNWSIARMMMIDGKRLSGIVAPQQHLGMVAQAWADLGKPMPFALALGVEPAIPFICGMPLPAHVDEGGRLGALLGRAIRTLRCRTVDLEAPASAEILIEGYLHLDELVEEGPMGEFAGYIPLDTQMRRPTYRVCAISHRENAILPVVVAGEPVEENHTAWGLPSSAQLLYELRKAGIPATTAWIPLQSALHWLVVTVPRDWRRRSGDGESMAFCRRIGQTVFASKAGAVIPKVIVLNDDVDPTDLTELVWAFATRCHPLLGHAVFDDIEASPLLAYLRRSEKISGHTGKIVYNCLAPDEWGEALPMRASFRHGYPAEIVDRVRRRWSEYGFKQASPIHPMSTAGGPGHQPGAGERKIMSDTFDSTHPAEIAAFVGKHIIYTYANGWQYEMYFKNDRTIDYRVHGGMVGGRWVKGQEVHIVRLADGVYKVSWHEPTGTCVSVAYNLHENRAHGATFFPHWIEQEPKKIIGFQNEKIDLMRQYRDAGPTYPTMLVDEFADITFVEDCGRDDESVIACAPEDLPPGYATRRNVS